MNKTSLKLLFCLFCIQTGFAQFTIPKKPDFQTSVYDYAKLLNDSKKTALEEKLIRYSDSTSTQIVIATVPTINGEDIGILTPKWAQEWGIGQAKEDNGVFILVAEQEHKIWISPGYGVEDKLTAGITGELVRNIIIPEFKAGSYYNGLDKGADAIFDVLKGKYKGTRKASGGKGFPAAPFIIIIIIIIILISRGRRGGNPFPPL
ncbi:MAG TPA: TPM domain-containing protein, partial [Flavobacterium sp.]|nr:TPM domain-containing protein [Flavobacterium sp.]